MTLYEFNVLETYAKAEEVWANGVRLGDRKDEGHRYILYQLNSFYVEIVYNPFENKIEKLQSFSTTTSTYQRYSCKRCVLTTKAVINLTSILLLQEEMVSTNLSNCYIHVIRYLYYGLG